MLLNNVSLLNESAVANITTREKKIIAIDNDSQSAGTEDFKINFTDAVAFPGLINSHDHLDFNCFSPLGHRTFNNYTEWGNHIHEVYKDEINTVLKIPQPLRTAWGMYKNLLAGVTTVVNHGEVLPIENPLITIYQEPQNLHSVKFQKNWKRKLNNPLLKNKTCVIHTGEGTDKQSADEIDELLKWNLLNRKLVGIHAVAMDSCQAKKFSGLVWCPESNKVLLNKHASITQLKKSAPVVFGTDSTLTGSWNIWQHLRLARSLELVSDEELFNMVTSIPAKLWAMNNGEICPGKEADIVIAKKTGLGGWDDLFSVNPLDILMILHNGKIRLFDKTLLIQLGNGFIDLKKFSEINIAGSTKFVEGDLPALLKTINSYHADSVFPVVIDEPIKHVVHD